jgi:hypothetical protein
LIELSSFSRFNRLKPAAGVLCSKIPIPGDELSPPEHVLDMK